MSIELPETQEDREILKTEVEALASLYEQEASVKDAISERAKSAAESLDMKGGDIKKLAKAKYLENAKALREEAELLEGAIDILFGED